MYFLEVNKHYYYYYHIPCKNERMYFAEFPDMYLKEEEEFPLNNELKEEPEIRNIDKFNLLNISSKIKKEVKNKGEKKYRKGMLR